MHIINLTIHLYPSHISYIHYISIIFTCFSWDFLASVRRLAGDGRSRRRKCFAPAFRRRCCTLPGGPWQRATNMAKSMAKSMELEEDIEWHRNIGRTYGEDDGYSIGYGRINFLLNTLAILIDCEWGLRRRLASQVLLILTACTWDEGVALHSGSHHGRGSLTSFSHHYHWIFRMEIHFYSLWICIMIIFITTGHKCHV